MTSDQTTHQTGSPEAQRHEMMMHRLDRLERAVNGKRVGIPRIAIGVALGMFLWSIVATIAGWLAFIIISASIAAGIKAAADKMHEDNLKASQEARERASQQKSQQQPATPPVLKMPPPPSDSTK